MVVHDEYAEQRMKELKDAPWETTFEEFEYFLGMHIVRDMEKGTISLDQDAYTAKIVSAFEERDGPTTSKLRGKHRPLPSTPLPERSKSTGEIHLPDFKGLKWAGCLQYLTHTRPDMVFGAHVASCYAKNPTMEQAAIVENIFGYLKNHPKGFITFGGGDDNSDDTVKLVSWTDSDFANRMHNRHSITGQVHFVNGGPVFTGSAKQKAMTGSSTEAELHAARISASNTIYLRRLLKELGHEQVEPTPLMVDNQGAVSIIEDDSKYGDIKHIDVSIRMLQSWHALGELKAEPTKDPQQRADIFTKGLTNLEHARKAQWVVTVPTLQIWLQKQVQTKRSHIIT
jgi:hypothetical protein